MSTAADDLEPEFEPPPEVHPQLAADVLVMLSTTQLRRQCVLYVADHGWDTYARSVLTMLRARGRSDCTRRAVDDDAHAVRHARRWAAR